MTDRVEDIPYVDWLNIIAELDPKMREMLDGAVTEIATSDDTLKVLSGIAVSCYMVGYRDATLASKAMDSQSEAGLRLFGAVKHLAWEFGDIEAQLSKSKGDKL